jgi:hypothetical protein
MFFMTFDAFVSRNATGDGHVARTYTHFPFVVRFAQVPPGEPERLQPRVRLAAPLRYFFAGLGIISSLGADIKVGGV